MDRDSARGGHADYLVIDPGADGSDIDFGPPSPWASCADQRGASAKFAAAFSRRGLMAEDGVSWLLPRIVGYGHASDLLLSSRPILGTEALEMARAQVDHLAVIVTREVERVHAARIPYREHDLLVL